MKRNALIGIIIAAPIISVGSAFWLTQSHDLLQPVIPPGKTTSENPKISHDLPQFGKSSLTESERNTLRTFMYSDEHLAYEKGMICLKHRLSRQEILELIAMTDDQTQSAVGYPFGASRVLVFDFDMKGNLTTARLSGSELTLPSLETVNSNGSTVSVTPH